MGKIHISSDLCHKSQRFRNIQIAVIALFLLWL